MATPIITVKNIREILDKYDKGDPDLTIKYIWQMLADENTEYIYIEVDAEVFVISLLTPSLGQAQTKVKVKKMDKKTGKWSKEAEINKKKAKQIAQGIRGVRI